MRRNSASGLLALAFFCTGVSVVALSSPAWGVAVAPATSSAGFVACVKGQIVLTPTDAEQPYNHIDVGPSSWSFGWKRSNGCQPVWYRMHENLLTKLAPGGNPQASKWARYVVKATSPMTGSSTMQLLRAATVGGKFWGCEQLDVAVKTETGWQHRWGGIVVAPGAGPNCAAPVTPVDKPTATVAASCKGTGSYELDNAGSTVTVVYGIVKNGVTTDVTVAAGASIHGTFSGAAPGSTVSVSASGRTLATAAVAAHCAPVTKPSGGGGGKPPVTKPSGGTGPKIVTDFVGPAALPGGAPTSFVFGIVSALAAVCLAASGIAVRRKRRCPAHPS